MIPRPPNSPLFPYTPPSLPPTAADQSVKVTQTRRFDNAFSPRLGLVYQPIKTTALFASYSNSFQPNTGQEVSGDRKSTRLNSSHANISYAVFCLKKKKKHHT